MWAAYGTGRQDGCQDLFFFSIGWDWDFVGVGRGE